MAKIKASTLLRNPADDEIVFLREGENAPRVRPPKNQPKNEEG